MHFRYPIYSPDPFICAVMGGGVVFISSKTRQSEVGGADSAAKPQKKAVVRAGPTAVYDFAMNTKWAGETRGTVKRLRGPRTRRRNCYWKFIQQ